MSNLLRLVGRRLVALPIMVVGVTLLVFFLMALSPVDQAYSALGENASAQAVQEYRESHGLNDPLPVQYWNYLTGLLTGDLGTYGANERPVVERVATSLPVTLQLTFFGLAIAVVLSVILGVISALFRDRWPDQVIRVFSIICIATPSFWLAVLFILLFSSTLHILPASGALPPITEDPAGWFARMTMPAVALALPVTGQLTRVMPHLDGRGARQGLRAHGPRVRHPDAGCGGEKRAAQRPHHPRHRARPSYRLSDRRCRGHRGHLQPSRYGHGDSCRHPVGLHHARPGRRARGGRHLHHHQHRGRHALYR